MPGDLGRSPPSRVAGAARQDAHLFAAMRLEIDMLPFFLVADLAHTLLSAPHAPGPNGQRQGRALMLWAAELDTRDFNFDKAGI